MSRINKAFENGKAFIAFLTAGDPSLEKTEEYILEMVRAGADLVEIGIPFSDPTAEGPVIQEANLRALKNPVTMDAIFEVVENVRKKTEVPLVFLTYMNPVYHYGYGEFFRKCNETGIDGIITPELPFEEKGEWKEYSDYYGVDLISMIAPTSDERIKSIASEATGFIYVVSSMGVTGVRSNITTDVKGIVEKIREVTAVPCAVGFGISTPEQAQAMAGISDGAIVGSAIVKIIAEHGENAAPHIYDYVKKMKEAVSE